MKMLFPDAHLKTQRLNKFPVSKSHWLVGSWPLGVIFFLMAFAGTAAKAQTADGASDADIKGRELARQLCDAPPTESFTNTGVLQIRDGKGNRKNIPVSFKTIAGADVWRFICLAPETKAEILIVHKAGQPNEYFNEAQSQSEAQPLAAAEIYQPFAGSDFSPADLGLEFLHWPSQKILPKPTNLKRGREYTLLESSLPNPATNGYSRVRSWIDKETGGILQAEAYDTQGKLLKNFEPKSFKKINGQWELEEMEISNVQADSRTRMEFDLNK